MTNPAANGTLSAEATHLRVVIADDALESRVLMRETLERADVNVVAEAADGRAAVRAACEYQPDVVVLDYLMPDHSGLEAIPEIRECSPRTKVLIVSALAEDQVHASAAHSTPDAWVPKGMPMDDLAEAVMRLGRGEGVGDLGSPLSRR